MRLIRVSAPKGNGEDVMRTAFSVGIGTATLVSAEDHREDGTAEPRDVIDIATSTPKGKRFIDALLTADYYDSGRYAIAVRSPVTVVSRETVREVTVPLPEPSTDILEELYQFSHVTYSLVGRIFIAGLLLAYGMIQSHLLLMIAGLLFLPLLPLLKSIGFGVWTRQWGLAGLGLMAFAISTALLVLAGVIVASMSNPPLRFDEFSSPGVGFLISLVVGIAAGLAIIDDAGKRELIGLAASAQIALVPVW